jgi:hypothetical protein
LPPFSLFFPGIFRVKCPSVFLHLPFPISKKRPGQEARSKKCSIYKTNRLKKNK